MNGKEFFEEHAREVYAQSDKQLKSLTLAELACFKLGCNRLFWLVDRASLGTYSTTVTFDFYGTRKELNRIRRVLHRISTRKGYTWKTEWSVAESIYLPGTVDKKYDIAVREEYRVRDAETGGYVKVHLYEPAKEGDRLPIGCFIVKETQASVYTNAVTSCKLPGR